MNTSPNDATALDTNMDAIFAEHFAALPAPVQRAITSANLEERLRSLAGTQKLHVDQWVILESEVKMALYGLEPLADLAKNIQNGLGISEAEADELAALIISTVFEPIRAELEKELGSGEPEAAEQAAAAPDEANGADAIAKMRRVILEEAKHETEAAADTQPAAPSPGTVQTTPPTTPAPTTPPPHIAPASGAYKPGEPSSVRKEVDDDPYRESIT